MSEPTYRIETVHRPTNGAAVRWEANVYLVADDGRILYDGYGPDETTALARAIGFCERRASEPEPGRVYLLDESGAPFEPQSPRA